VRLSVASAASTVHNLRIEISPVAILPTLPERPAFRQSFRGALARTRRGEIRP
jgi:hypothetical protein